MEDAPIINEPPRYLKIVIWIVSIIIAGFYIVSAFGWFAATYMMSVGVLGKEAADFYHSLNIAEKLIRASQVILIVTASITLLLKRRITLKLVLISISISLISFLFFEKWSISFLGGIPGILYLTIVYAYAYWLNRRGVLRRQNKSSARKREDQQPRPQRRARRRRMTRALTAYGKVNSEKYRLQ